MITKIVHVQSVLPDEIVVSLMKKSGESSVKEAISKAVYHYLNCQDLDHDNRKKKTTSIFRDSRIDTRDIDAQKNELGFEKLSAVESIPDTDTFMKERALNDSVTFMQDTDSQLEVQADKERFKQIISNLLSYGPEDTTDEIAKSDFDSKR
jgi:hypothetical protein